MFGLLHRWVLMNEAGGADTGGAPAAPAATPETPAPAAPAGGSGAAATPEAPASLEPPAALTDAPAAPETPTDPAKPETPVEPEKPIEYTDFTLPEGVEVNAEVMSAFKEAAAGAKLSQEQAQGFVDMYQKALNEASTKPYEAWRDTQKQWQDTIKADPEFGGAKLEAETLPAIARAIQQFTPNADAQKALRQAFSFTGAGNNPEVIRFIARIGKTLAEGTHVGGSPAGGDGGKSAAAKLYPSAGTGNGQAQS